MKVMYETTHQIRVAAPAGTVFDLIADIDQWPIVFPPIVHTERLPGGGAWQRARIHTWTGDRAATWVALRRPLRGQLRLDYRQEQPWPPVLDMGGSWTVEPDGDSACVVHLHHDYRSAQTDNATLSWIGDLLDKNSKAELAALKEAAERDQALLTVFSESLRIGAEPERIYRFLCDAEAWPDHIPHVTSAKLTPLTPDAALLEMDTRTDEGTVYHARSVRVCLPDRQIVQKYLLLPPIAALHIAAWLVDGGTVTAKHTVVVTDVQAREFARQALSDNSRLTLAAVKATVEADPQ
jgi:aromatase